MAIVGEKLRDYVTKQIEVRQEKLSPNYIKTDQDLIYFNAKTAWVKMASGVSIDLDKLKEIIKIDDPKDLTQNEKDLLGMGLAKKHILFGGTADYISQHKPLQIKQGFGTPFDTSKTINPSSYDITSQFGIVPNPGIKDMSLKCLNRGSLKKAKLKIRVENKFQLQIIDVLYLRLGYTMLLEWGNSHYYDNKGKLKNTEVTLIEKKFFEKDNMDFRSFLSDIEDLRNTTNGNYDGFIGKVSNFDWSFNEDGSYDINLELISLGDVIESLKSNVTLDNKTSDYILTSTAGSTNITITNTGDPINSNRTLNSLFSILYLWKDQNKQPQEQLVNRGNGTYSTNKGIKIDYTSGTDQTIAFIGDCLDPDTSDELDFTTGKYTLTIKLGYLDTLKATKGDYSTYKLKGTDSKYLPQARHQKKDGTQTSVDEDGVYGYYKLVEEPTTLTLKGSTNLSTKKELINNIIGAENSGSLVAADGTPVEFTGNEEDFKALQFYLKYGKWNEDLTPGVDFTDTNPLMTGGGGLDRDTCQKYYKYVCDKNLIYALRWNFYDTKNIDDGSVGTYMVSKKAFSSSDKHYIYVYDSSEDIVNRYKRGNKIGPILYYLYYHNTNLYVSNRADFIYPPSSYATDKIYKYKDRPGGGGNFGGLKFNRFHMSNGRADNEFGYYDAYSGLSAGTATNPEKLDYKLRVDVPFAELNITTTTTTTITVNNPLKKFGKKDVVRLYNINKEGQNTYFFYMRFGALLQTLKNEVLSRIDVGEADNSKNPSIVGINNDNDPGTKAKPNPNFKSYMVNKPNLTSFDVTKCFVKSSLKFDGDGTTEDNSYKLFHNQKDCIQDWEIDDKEANSMNIYLSFRFIGKTLESNTDSQGNISVYSFIKGLCDGINRSFANVSNLEPIISETTNELSIVDSSKNRAKNDKSYTLNPFSFAGGKGCFVRKVDLKTAITPAYATMVTVGATAGGYVKGVEATAFSNWNRGLNDRYKTELKPASNTNSVTKQGQVKDAIEAFQKVWLTDKSSMLTPLGYQNNPLEGIKVTSGGGTVTEGWITNVTPNTELINSNNQIADEYFRAYSSDQKDGSSLGFIPFNVTLRMDGISGIKIYNEVLLNTQFLPENYSTNLSFIVTGVDHALKNNDWETTLKLTLIPLSKKEKYTTPTTLSFTKRKYTFKKINVVNDPTPPTPDKKFWDGTEEQFKTREVRSITLHITVGNRSAQKTVEYVNRVNHPQRVAWGGINGIHWAIDRTGTTAQGIPEDKRSIHGDNWNTNGIGIEIANYGHVKKGNDGKWKNTYGGVVPDSEVVDLGFKWEGHQYYQDYTDIQISGLKTLIQGIIGRHPKIKDGITGKSAWKYVFGLPAGKPNSGDNVKAKDASQYEASGIPTGGLRGYAAYKQYGIFSHTTGGGTHTDPIPTPKLVNMLKSLGYID